MDAERVGNASSDHSELEVLERCQMNARFVGVFIKKVVGNVSPATFLKSRCNFVRCVCDQRTEGKGILPRACTYRDFTPPSRMVDSEFFQIVHFTKYDNGTSCLDVPHVVHREMLQILLLKDFLRSWRFRETRISIGAFDGADHITRQDIHSPTSVVGDALSILVDGAVKCLCHIEPTPFENGLGVPAIAVFQVEGSRAIEGRNAEIINPVMQDRVTMIRTVVDQVDWIIALDLRDFFRGP